MIAAKLNFIHCKDVRKFSNNFEGSAFSVLSAKRPAWLLGISPFLKLVDHPGPWSFCNEFVHLPGLSMKK